VHGKISSNHNPNDTNPNLTRRLSDKITMHTCNKDTIYLRDEVITKYLFNPNPTQYAIDFYSIHNGMDEDYAWFWSKPDCFVFFTRGAPPLHHGRVQELKMKNKMCQKNVTQRTTARAHALARVLTHHTTDWTLRRLTSRITPKNENK
jgi:hypothetical protein